jgi:lysophospholipase L1-like esterase
MRRPSILVLFLVLGLVAAACSSGGTDRSASRKVITPRAPRPAVTGPVSIVQLGDSIASGEGTLYGYQYDADTGKWTGGDLNVKWDPPYQLCHDSHYAYGQVVAVYFGAKFTQFACTGATFAAGISAPEYDNGTPMRPAQFGDWANKTDLNAEYDAANPDVVLVTFGADDLQFSPIVEACIKNGYWHYFHVEDLECTSSNPGDTIQKDYFDALPTLKKNYATIVQWIEQRAKINSRPVPKIVITNYANPLPPDGKECPDTSWLYSAQTKYLSSLVTQIDGIIEKTVAGLKDKNVALADISDAYTPHGTSHIWCAKDPWAYGLSIYSMAHPSSFDSQAPFHPTPDGQDSIAAHVIPLVRTFFPPPTTTTTPATTTSSAPTPSSTTSAAASSTTTSSTAPPTTSTSQPPATSTG